MGGFSGRPGHAGVAGLEACPDPHRPAPSARTLAAGRDPGVGGRCFRGGRRHQRTPDLVVLDPRKKAEFRDGHATSASGVRMFVEMTSNSTRRVDLREKPGEYARAEVPVMLIVDREKHEVIVHFEPVDGRYTFTGRVRAGAPVRLPEPFDATVDTGFLLDHL
ncbi:Uma2 family endonuclease [Embleya sp. NPDC005971]|uniref:Uma2 family endonuclease n=1 Tax=Embleya sp. NPDC005971 TaxID=3156724 RepID=UPI0033F12160